MKYRLINTKTSESHLCDKVTIDGFDYYVSDKIIKDVRPYYGKWQVEEGTILNKFPTYLTDLSSCRLVIATNNSNIDDVPKVVDEVERLANWATEETQSSRMKRVWKSGYNKSQETHPFSEDDAVEFGDWIRNNPYVWNYPDKLKDRRTTKELFQLWKEQRIKTLYYE